LIGASQENPVVKMPIARLAVFVWLAVCCVACAPIAQASRLFAQPWNSGQSRSEPPFQTQQIDADTYALRQSLQTTFEAPFLYLLFGDEKALLIDTGVAGAPLGAEVDRLIADWSAANLHKRVSLVVMHSHGHADHVGGDGEFSGRADTVVVGHSEAEVAAFFGIGAWPAEQAAFDLGGRVVDIVPTPGHHPSHVMVFDRRTGILFSGDTVYPGRLYFQCARIAEFRASIDRVAAFAATRQVRWLLGAHIEMRTAPGRSFEANDRIRRNEHLLELPPAVLEEIRLALTHAGTRPRVRVYDDFILFPHPPNPRGEQPPDWCLDQPTTP
jgi:glyoxylase-like metal-dependent hydrolase (beta-lactamase superfamily II)